MAKIYLSFSLANRELVDPYIRQFRFRKHELIEAQIGIKPLDIESAVYDAQMEAEGTVCFITEEALKSESVIDEINKAIDINNIDDRRFVILLVFGNIELPVSMRHLYIIQAQDLEPNLVVSKIETEINDFFYKYKRPNKRIQRRNEASSQTEAAMEIPASILAEGNKGKKVTELQQKLKTLNLFTSVADGVFGRATTEAVKKFQERYGLRPTGEWDEASEEKYQELESISGNSDDPYFSMQEAEDTASQNANAINDPFNNSGEASIPSTQYWFLKIYADDWGMENIDANDEGFFNSHFNSKQPRPDYENFKAVRIGDKGVAYDYSSLKSALFLFEVIQPLYKDPVRDEIIKFRVIRFLDPYIPYGSFSGFLSFSPDTSGADNLSLFRMTEPEYNALINAVPQNMVPPVPPTGTGEVQLFNKATLSEVFSDSASKDIADQLGFEADVDALARVIAYEEVKPPLAVGLFGHWGSGKSFFMNKLQQRIDQLSKEDGDVFCKEVVQINFNSWHYSDSNLWASLITKIFDDLKKYGKGKTKELDNLFKNLNSTQELLTEAKQKIIMVESEINSLKGRQNAVEIEIKKNTQGLKNLSFDDITTAVMADPGISERVEKAKKEFDFLRLEEYKQVQSNIAEIETGGKRFIKSLQILYSFKTWKSWFALLMAAFIVFVLYYAVAHVEDVRKHIGKYRELVGAAAVIVSQVLLFLRPVLKNIKRGYEYLTSLKQSLDEAVVKKQNEFNATREALKTKLQQAQVVQTNLRTAIEELESKKTQLKIEVTDIASGKKIVRFIEGRVSDERYMNSLGIISWIRKDFEELDFLLKQQYDAEKREELNKEFIPDIFKIDRIILYIDDLDRCDVAIVVRVLEAINLLLAFPLFVVIVGVDPRWMHNALEIKYAQMLRSGQEKATDARQMNLPETGNPATSYDYLEKIFQVPFVLKPMDRTGKENLIRSQLQNKPPAGKEKEREKEEEKEDGLLHKVKDQEAEDAATGADAAGTLNTGKTPGELQEAVNKAREIAAAKAREEEDKKKKEDATTKPVLESLLIAGEEVSFMQAIGFLIGDSPRTIKRYINMYRIIRTHARFEFTDDNYLEHYYAAMVLLAVVTGSPDEAPVFFDRIRSFDEEKTFRDFFTKNPDILKKDSAKSNELKTALEKDKQVKLLQEISIKKFNKNISLISRFSFRHLQE